MTITPIVIGALATVTEGFVKGPEIGKNTVKSSRDLNRLAVTQNPIKDHQVMLM